jgi:two-component system chemotaxis sensor kinase CheA
MSRDSDLPANELQEIIGDFLVEADELVASLDTNLVKLEGSPSDPDLLNEIFRATHTIKGTSGFLGLTQITQLTHHVEDVLNSLRKNEITATPGIIDALLVSLDTLRQLLNCVRSGDNQEIDIARSESLLDAAVRGQSSASGKGSSVSQPGPETENGVSAGGDQTVRVDVERLDALVNLVGEFVQCRNSLQQVISEYTDVQDRRAGSAELRDASALLNCLTSELQLAVMKLRMRPVRKVFAKLPRQVRDLARDIGKEVDLRMSGESTEVDKSIVDEIGEPLTHLIRNACDHGIEPPEEREANGKPRRGMVNLSARHEASTIVIEITDDGRGLDADAIRTKAIAKGMISEEATLELTEQELFRFIFESGFSTAEKITYVSGRGVGMDVVRRKIESLNGLIEVSSKPGEGTTVRLCLPLTVAIVQGLLIESDEEVFILPMSGVQETVRIVHDDLTTVNQRPVLRLRDEIIPIVNLNRLLRKNRRAFASTEKSYAVVAGRRDHKLGIVADRLLGEEEVVIKSLDQDIGLLDGLTGAAVLGDGRVRLIVDIPSVARLAGSIG